MSALQLSCGLVMLLSAALLRPAGVAVPGDVASGACTAATSYGMGDAAGRLRLEAKIGMACLAGPLPEWAVGLGVLGIRAGIQHDAAGFSMSVDASPFLHRFSLSHPALFSQVEA